MWNPFSCLLSVDGEETLKHPLPCPHPATAATFYPQWELRHGSEANQDKKAKGWACEGQHLSSKYPMPLQIKSMASWDISWEKRNSYLMLLKQEDFTFILHGSSHIRQPALLMTLYPHRSTQVTCSHSLVLWSRKAFTLKSWMTPHLRIKTPSKYTLSFPGTHLFT